MTNFEQPSVRNGDLRTLRSARRLHTLGWSAMLGFMVWQGYTSEVRETLHLVIAFGIIVLAGLPALRWAKNAETALPAFEVFMLSAIPFYALPLLRQHPATLIFPDESLTRAGLAVVALLASALLAHGVLKVRPLEHRVWRESLFPEEFVQYAHAGMFANTLFLYILNFTSVIPDELVSVARALLFGVGIVCIFLLSRLWGVGNLRPAGKFAFVVNLFLQFVFLCSTLYLISAASLLLLALAGYVTGSRRLPFIFIGVSLIVLSLLHNGKSEMRRIYWFEEAPRLAAIDLPEYFGEWFGYALEAGRDHDQPVTSSIMERASLFHIMCILVHQTPRYQPFLDGETYASIPSLLVPRLLWPGKPAPHESNRRLAVYYGFVTEDSVSKVSIAFGTPAEAYANFGFSGVIALGALFGAMFKAVTGWARECPVLSAGGLAVVLLLAWSFQAEMTLAIWITSLFQASVALLAVPMLLKLATSLR